MQFYITNAEHLCKCVCKEIVTSWWAYALLLKTAIVVVFTYTLVDIGHL